ncbi:hypothetical protein ABVF61_29030 [Roseibium sp. HPY-6]|uniref:hypothetical protein n=1 Tax=Roseibium sp. HPY-6 TaxID=3229852 RepID=UPI00338F771D
MLNALRRNIAPLLMPVMASVLLLVLFEVHTAIFRRAQTLIGLRAEAPIIVATEDRCRGRVARSVGSDVGPLFVTSAYLQPERATQCFERMTFIVAVTPGKTVHLFVNNQRVAVRKSHTRLVRFHNVPMQPLHNVVHVSTNESRLWLPFGSPSSHATFDLRQDQRRAGNPLFGAAPRRVELSTMAVPGPANEQGTHPLGSWTLPDGRELGLAAIPPFAAFDPNEISAAADTYVYNRDDLAGLVLYDIPRETDSLQIAAHGTRQPAFFRRLVATHDPDTGTISVEASACLPAEHYLSAPSMRARGRFLSGEIWVARLFQTQVGRHDQVGYLSSHKTAVVEEGGAGQDERVSGCSVLSTRYSVDDALFSLRGRGSASFPHLPGDRLELNGFGANMDIYGKTEAAIASQSRSWAGALGGGFTSLHVFGPFRTGETENTLRNDASAASISVFADASTLFQLMPGSVLWLMWALAAVLPVALMRYVVSQPETASIDQALSLRAKAGLNALMIFGIAYAVQPVMTETARWLLDFSGLNVVLTDLAFYRALGQNLAAPVALMVVVLMRPALMGVDGNPLGPAVVRKIAAGLLTLVLIAVGVYLLSDQSGLRDLGVSHQVFNWLMQFPQFDEILSSPPAYMLKLIAAVLDWSLCVLALSWVTVWLVQRSITRRSSKGVFWTALLIFFLILLPPMFDLLNQGVALVEIWSSNTHNLLFAWFSWLVAAGDLSSPYIMLFVLAVLILDGFASIAEVLLPGKCESWFKHSFRWPALILLAVFIVAPLATRGSLDQYQLNSAINQLMGTFQKYGPVIALLAGYSVLWSVNRTRAPTDNPFTPPEVAFLVCAAAFSGYVAVWQLNPISIVPLMVLGWFAFNLLLLSPTQFDKRIEARPTGIAKKLLDYRKEMRLCTQLSETARKELTSGKISDFDYRVRNNRVAWRKREAGEALGMPPEEAKAWVLDFGPRDTPLANAYLGALYGLVVAFVMQLALPLAPSISTIDNPQGVLAFLKWVLTDPGYNILATNSETSPFLSFASRFLNAFTLWAVAGFLFGYTFHRIRGSDGFVKALAFCFVITGAHLLYWATTGSGTINGLEVLARVLPIVLFLLALGTLVFDGGSLQKQGVGLSGLVDIYGLKSTLGYASVASVVAIAQPFLSVIEWVTGKRE